MLRAVIFDMDGVLVSTDELHYRSWVELAAARGIPFERATFDERMRGLGRAEATAVLLEAAGRPHTAAEIPELMAEKQRTFLALLLSNPPEPLPGLIDLLDALEAEGWKRAVASSSRNTTAVLSACGLAARFATVVDGNEFPSKPRPEVFLAAAQRLALAPHECLVIEDAPDGVLAAQRAGMPVLALGPPERFSAVPVIPSLVGVTPGRLRELFVTR